MSDGLGCGPVTIFGSKYVAKNQTQSPRFEQFGASLDEFLAEHVFGPGYPVLAGVEDDQWCRLLRRLGRLG